MKVIDCRNLACPQPVIAVKKALEESAELQVLLDDGAPRENVGRFVRNRGCTVTEERNDDGWRLTIVAGGGVPRSDTAPAAQGAGTVLLVTSDRIGDGPEDLGRLLMKNFVHTLLEAAALPEKLFFMNRGVFLTTEGSDLLEALDKLAGMGVEIYSCGLCLDFFGLKEKLRAGATTNMLTTADSLLAAARVIRL